MIVINRLCRSNANKCLINYISTTVTARCEKPEGEKKSKERDDGINEERKSEEKPSLKKIYDLFEDNISEEKKREAKEKLKTISLKLAPVSKTVSVTQKKQPVDLSERPVKEAAKKARSRLEYNLVQSAKIVADEFGGDVKKTDGDLLKALSKFLDNAPTEPKETEKEEKVSKKGETEKGHVKPDIARADVTTSRESKRLKGILSGINKVSKQEIEDQDLKFFDLVNNSEGLNIFHPDLERNEGLKLKLWDELQKHELKFLTSSSPRNYFEELIKWTEEGKLWHFPINNEQGMDEEANVDFSEHVFLEDYLEPWCPKSGPLKHFMELVCVGLSKNPYLTVADKRDHIYWFRDYFEEKKRILQELGALASRKEIEKPKKTEEKHDTE